MGAFGGGLSQHALPGLLGAEGGTPKTDIKTSSTPGRGTAKSSQTPGFYRTFMWLKNVLGPFSFSLGDEKGDAFLQISGRGFFLGE
jgi:hypothetical protein